MNGIVDSYITGVIESRKISGPDLAILASLRNSGGLKSIQTLDGLPNSVRIVVKEAFREGVRWSFISLIPWAGAATIGSLFLSKIQDTDAKMTGSPHTSKSRKHVLASTDLDYEDRPGE